MREHLLFTLYGPIQAWGTPAAVGEERPTAGHPARSAVLGLLAGALGIRRDEEARLAALTAGYGVAVATVAAGERFVDYHTVQVAGTTRNRVFRTRSDEVGGLLTRNEDLNTILSSREYLADACFKACLWIVGAPPAPHTLKQLREALCNPVFVPSLGRKACPTAMPFDPMIIEADDAGRALLAYRPCRGFTPSQRRRLLGNEATPVHVWADSGHGWPDVVMKTTVRDMATDHARRQFGLRTEEHFILPAGDTV